MIRHTHMSPNLREIREHSKRSISFVAKKLRLSVDGVTEIETGEFLNLSIGTVERYLEVMGWDLRLTATFQDGRTVQINPWMDCPSLKTDDVVTEVPPGSEASRPAPVASRMAAASAGRRASKTR